MLRPLYCCPHQALDMAHLEPSVILGMRTSCAKADTERLTAEEYFMTILPAAKMTNPSLGVREGGLEKLISGQQRHFTEKGKCLASSVGERERPKEEKQSMDDACLPTSFGH